MLRDNSKKKFAIKSIPRAKLMLDEALNVHDCSITDEHEHDQQQENIYEALE